MRKDEDGLPTVGRSASELGARPGVDIDVVDGDVLSNGKGMSVSPAWREISILRIPKRLREKVSGARGSNNTYCFRYGEGPFQDGPLAPGLVLARDSSTHGCVTPAKQIPLETYEGDLAATRAGWQIDEA